MSVLLRAVVAGTLVGFAFGVVTVYVPGEDAAGYRFTSALPVEILRQTGPIFALDGEHAGPSVVRPS